MSPMSSLSRRPATVALAAIVLLALSVTAAVAQQLGYRGGPLRWTHVVTSTDAASTTSSTFTPVPGGRVAFGVGERAPHQHVLVTFSGESTCATTGPAARTCRIRVMVDGREADPVAAHELAFDDATSIHAPESHAIQRVYGPIGAGRHEVRVEFATSAGDTTFTLDDWTLSLLSVEAR